MARGRTWPNVRWPEVELIAPMRTTFSEGRWLVYRSVAETASAVLAHVHGAEQALQDTPLSPFSSDELQQFTGSPIGMRQVRGMRAVGRNELCPCGSGKKYKVCHGR